MSLRFVLNETRRRCRQTVLQRRLSTHAEPRMTSPTWTSTLKRIALWGSGATFVASGVLYYQLCYKSNIYSLNELVERIGIAAARDSGLDVTVGETQSSLHGTPRKPLLDASFLTLESPNPENLGLHNKSFATVEELRLEYADLNYLPILRILTGVPVPSEEQIRTRPESTCPLVVPKMVIDGITLNLERVKGSRKFNYHHIFQTMTPDEEHPVVADPSAVYPPDIVIKELEFRNVQARFNLTAEAGKHLSGMTTISVVIPKITYHNVGIDTTRDHNSALRVMQILIFSVLRTLGNLVPVAVMKEIFEGAASSLKVSKSLIAEEHDLQISDPIVTGRLPDAIAIFEGAAGSVRIVAKDAFSNLSKIAKGTRARVQAWVDRVHQVQSGKIRSRLSRALETSKGLVLQTVRSLTNFDDKPDINDAQPNRGVAFISISFHVIVLLLAGTMSSS